MLCFLNRLSHFLSHEMLLKFYKQTILPAIDYMSIIWIDCSKVMSDKLERLQNQALRSILKKDRKTRTQWLREKCHLLSVKNRRRFLRFQLVFKIVKHQNCPEHKLHSHKGKFTIKIIKGGSKRYFSTLLQRIRIDYLKNSET